ncbi:aldolase [Anaeramoeba flamelloides]|uniref:deoxyribose-phosphate aldolase n=1 Tax=Anaeramoeba flamelloides TaxID=1746091 RepID=A0ABQ8YGI5_9EUKA|nr:aldolase [Anaeramoeba flamelloides]
MTNIFKKSKILQEIGSTEEVNNFDDYWPERFEKDFPLPLLKNDVKQTRVTLREFFNSLLTNNSKTRNVAKFLRFATNKLEKLKKKKIKNKPALLMNYINLLTISRLICSVVFELKTIYIQCLEIKEYKWELKENFQEKEKPKKKKKKKNKKKKKKKKKKKGNEKDQETKEENGGMNKTKKLNKKTVFSDLVPVLIDLICNFSEVTNFDNYIVQLESIKFLIVIISEKLFWLSSGINSISEKIENEGNVNYNGWSINILQGQKINWIDKVFLQIDKQSAFKLSRILLLNSLTKNTPPDSPNNSWNSKNESNSKKKTNTKQFSNDQLNVCSLSLLLSLMQIRPPKINLYKYVFLQQKQKQKQQQNQELNNIKKYENYFKIWVKDLNHTKSTKIIEEDNLQFDFFYQYLNEKNYIDDQILLLLYHLIHKNRNFIDFLLKEPEKTTQFILKILHTLYIFLNKSKDFKKEKCENYSRSLYLFFSIILILTQEKKFCEIIFDAELTNVSWIKSKRVLRYPLGNFLLLIITEFINENIYMISHIKKIKICFGILGNLSISFKKLSSEVINQFFKIYHFLGQKITTLTGIESEEITGQWSVDDQSTSIKESQKKGKMRKRKEKKEKKKKKSGKSILQYEIFQGDYQLEDTLFLNWVNVESLNPPPTTLKRPDRLHKEQLSNQFDVYHSKISHELLYYTDLLVIICELFNNVLTKKISKNCKFIPLLLKYENRLLIFKHHPRVWKYISNIISVLKYFKDVLKQHITKNKKTISETQAIDCLVFDQKTKNLIRSRINFVAKQLGLQKEEILKHFNHLNKDKLEISEPNHLERFIDHTNLHSHATSKDIKKLCDEAIDYNFYSVCVNSSRVPEAVNNLRGTGVKIASVVGFHLGATSTSAKVHETEFAINSGATEIDMVINVGKLKDLDYKYVLNDVKSIVDCGASTKVILETALLDEIEIIDASILSVLADAHFVKTSTGFSTGGAKSEDIRLMKLVVGEEREVKASGGIRNFNSASEMIQNGATRIGASKGVQIVDQERNPQLRKPKIVIEKPQEEKKKETKQEKKDDPNTKDILYMIGLGATGGFIAGHLLTKLKK